MWASYKGHATVVELLLAAGADKNLKDKVSLTRALQPS
jgi:ankyrin repeat protein